jgi:hypothetical protein
MDIGLAEVVTAAGRLATIAVAAGTYARAPPSGGVFLSLAGQGLQDGFAYADG